jgi:hypothetical protein
MRPSLRQVLFRSVGLDLNFAGGVFSLNNTRTASPAAIPGWSFSRTDTNGIATALDLAGNVIQFATGVPRITNRGILVEEARTNLLLNSAWAGVSSGAPTSWTVLLNGGGVAATSTIGAPNAMTFTASANRPSIFQDVAVAANTTYSASLFVEANPNGLDAFQMMTLVGAPVGSTVTGPTGVPVAGQRITATVAVGGTSGTVTIRAGAGVSSSSTGTVRLSLPQFELGAFATSPIITTGAAGTRGADVALVGSLTSFAYPLTMVGEWSREGGTDAATFYRVAALEPNLDDRSDIFQRHTTNDVRASQRSSGGVLLADITLGTGSIGSGQKAAVRFATDNVGGSLNGAAVVADTSVAMSASPIRLCVGSSSNGASNYLTGYIRRVRVLPFAATDIQLQALTAP